MAKKRSRTVSKKKRHRGRGYFSPNAYNNPFYHYLRYRRKTQRGGLLRRYDFACASRDAVNQAAKHLNTLGPKLITQIMNEATNGLDKVTARRVEQLSRETGETLKKIAPQLIRNAIVELYKTPFRLLGKLGRQKYKELKRNVFNRLKIK